MKRRRKTKRAKLIPFAEASRVLKALRKMFQADAEEAARLAIEYYVFFGQLPPLEAAVAAAMRRRVDAARKTARNSGSNG